MRFFKASELLRVINGRHQLDLERAAARQKRLLESPKKPEPRQLRIVAKRTNFIPKSPGVSIAHATLALQDLIRQRKLERRKEEQIRARETETVSLLGLQSNIYAHILKSRTSMCLATRLRFPRALLVNLRFEGNTFTAVSNMRDGRPRAIGPGSHFTITALNKRKIIQKIFGREQAKLLVPDAKLEPDLLAAAFRAKAHDINIYWKNYKKEGDVIAIVDGLEQAVSEAGDKELVPRINVRDILAYLPENLDPVLTRGHNGHGVRLASSLWVLAAWSRLLHDEQMTAPTPTPTL